MATIDEVAEKSGKKGVYLSLKSDGKTYTVFSDTEAFKQLTEKQFKVGDKVKLDYTESSGTYNAKPVVYKNLVKISAMTTEEAAAEPVPKTFTQGQTGFPKDSEKWDRKDKRITRMASL